MPSSFPTNPDTFTTKVDGVDTVMAVHINDLQDATTAIEQALLGDIPDGNVQYVKKAATSTDNAIPRFDGTDGKKLQNSGVTIDDSNNIKVGTAPVPTSVTSSTDNAVVRFDGTGGNKVQNSIATLDDNGDYSGKLINGMLINYQYVANNPASDIFVKLATLPKSDSGNYASIRMDGVIGGFKANEIAAYEFLAANRDSEQFQFTYLGSKTYFFNMRINVYKRDTGELDIGIFIIKNAYGVFNCNLTSIQGTIERTPASFSPSGTKVFDSYDFTA